MNGRTVVAVCAAVALFACQREVKEPTVHTHNIKTTTVAGRPADLERKRINEAIPLGPPLVDDKGIGPKLGPDGNVTGEEKTFKVTDPINLTMRFHNSPAGLQSSIVVESQAGTTAYRNQRAMNGAKVVTFTVPPKTLKPGHYRVDGYWGGNVAAEYEIEVR